LLLAGFVFLLSLNNAAFIIAGERWAPAERHDAIKEGIGAALAGQAAPAISTSPSPLSTLLQRFACARLPRSRRPDCCPNLDCNAHHHGF
jgi:hypothetical protein